MYGLNAKLIKTVGNLVAVPLTSLLNLCITTATYPDCFKVARVCPIYKKGAFEEPSSYRPVSIVPVLGKVFEKLLKKQVVDYFEGNSLLSTAQCGFRRGRSTVSAISKLSEIVTEAFESKEYVGSMFLDLSKAFDCVSPGILVEKLLYYGFSHRSKDLMHSYLYNRKQKVSINNQESKLLSCNVGVPQGSVLGPVLFIIFTNDMIDDKLIVYADDTTIIDKASNLNVVLESLGDAQSRAKKWLMANKLRLNEAKTQTMIFGLRQIPIANNTDVRFLGVYLDPKLSWETHISHLCKKIATNIYVLRRLSEIVSRQVMGMAFHALIQSHVNYALLIWGHAPDASRVFALQRRAVRIISGMGYRDNCREAFKDLGILTLASAYIYQCLLHIKQNSETLQTHSDIHVYETRQRDDLYPGFHRIQRSRTGINFYGPKLFNKLPTKIKSLDYKKFKKQIKTLLVEGAFYNITEFLNCTM